MVNKKAQFKKICRNIKSVRIQGATNLAKASIKAYYLFPSKKTKKILLSLRPTEPMLSHVLNLVNKYDKKEILKHFSESQELINKYVFSLIKNNSVIYTHCHSTNVVNSLIYAKKHGKKFEVYNTETRPLFQGRRTAKELKRAGIKVTMFVDSGAEIAIKKSKMVFLGADALLKKGVINKIGSGMISDIAKLNKIPLYIIADSWKYAHKNVKIEERNFKEVWGTKLVHIKNPAFEFVPKENINKIITEKGIMSYNEFLRKI